MFSTTMQVILDQDHNRNIRSEVDDHRTYAVLSQRLWHFLISRQVRSMEKMPHDQLVCFRTHDATHPLRDDLLISFPIPRQFVTP